MTRILGIDPGSLFTGFGLVEKQGQRLVHLASGRIKVQGPLEGRLLTIFQELNRLINEFRPTDCALEKIFHAKNAQSSLVLGHARGVALLAAAQGGLKLHEYAPTEIKNALVGQGRADKAQVQAMVKILLNLKEAQMSEDESDALAAAICHAHAFPLKAAAGGRV